MKILKFINKNSPVERVLLQSLFGDSVKRSIGALAASGLVETKIIDEVPVIIITDAGKEKADPGFCSSCECNPCDCNWGN